MWKERLFQDIPDKELPQAKLITDFYGIYHYSANPSSVITKYVNNMHEDGTIGIVSSINDDVVRLDNKDIPLYEWLSSVSKGQLSIEHGVSKIKTPNSAIADKDGFAPAEYMLVKNPTGKPIELPNLTLVGYTAPESKLGGRIFRPSESIKIHDENTIK